MKLLNVHIKIRLILMSRRRTLGSQFEMLCSLQAKVTLDLTLLAFQSKHNFTCCFRLLVENWLGLSTEAHLFRVVPALSLCKITSLTGLVLCHFVNFMPFAFLSSAVRLTLFWDIHHFDLLRETGWSR